MSDYSENHNNPKFKQIVATAKELFYRYGIKRVTTEEICRESGVSKMTFYKFFPNKLELAKFLLNSIFDAATDEYRDIIEGDLAFDEKLTALLDLKRRGTQNAGAEFIAELVGHPEPGVAELYKQHYDRSLAMTMEFMQKAQKKGDIRADVKLEFIMYMMNKMIELTMDDSLAQMYETPQDQIMELTNFFFYGILKRKLLDKSRKTKDKRREKGEGRREKGEGRREKASFSFALGKFFSLIILSL